MTIHKITYLDTLAGIADLWTGKMYSFGLWQPVRWEVQRVAGLLWSGRSARHFAGCYYTMHGR